MSGIGGSLTQGANVAEPAKRLLGHAYSSGYKIDEYSATKRCSYQEPSFLEELTRCVVATVCHDMAFGSHEPPSHGTAIVSNYSHTHLPIALPSLRHGNPLR